jgi:hypothetical protein
MKTLLQAAFLPHVVFSAIRVALVVGTMLNLINQGDALFHGHDLSWFHLVSNYLVPYCVSSYSAAQNELTRSC